MMISPLRREFLSKNEMAEATRLDPAKVVLCERLMKVMNLFPARSPASSYPAAVACCRCFFANCFYASCVPD